MKKVLVLLAAGVVALSGCAAQLSEADRELLNKAVESGRNSSQSLQAAEAAATRAEQAASRAEQAAAQSEAAARAADAAASQAASQAGQAEQNALKAEKAFEMKIKK
ncbi:MAG: hypothetical protein A2005_11240 [Desulfuromonadales bacterium GWC2_61_20]|nr:MAG: hypothetical protein A2005_11240 [Desulfuromonadales bacterium GWC2_61_20]